MIRHIVMFTAKSPENVETIYEGLKTLETIKGNWTLTVTKNSKIDRIANDIDVVVYGEFPDEASLSRYKDDPVYQRSTETVRPLRDKRFAVDIPA
ncbi:MAG: Dabb family protein [Alphaproteobacteria bacterium]|nr:Dabb family protein [Alphaproteobacteria bacterium]